VNPTMYIESVSVIKNILGSSCTLCLDKNTVR